MTLAEKIDFELVSPEEKLSSSKAYMVVVPGEEGDFAAMPSSSSVLSILRPGVVRVFMEKHQQQDALHIFISGGFADVTATQCTVLAEQAMAVEDLVLTDIEQNIRYFQEDLSMTDDLHKRQQIEQKLRIAYAQLEALTGKVSSRL